jgi:hypothetical protein
MTGAPVDPSTSQSGSGKRFLDAQGLLRDSYRLALAVLESDFRPNFMIGIWRGGTPVGIAVQEYLEFAGVSTDHIAIRTSSYTGIRQRSDDVQVHGLDYMVRKLNVDDRLLIVDDVFDTGLSIEAAIRDLKGRLRRNLPADLRVATVWFKPGNNRTGRVPDYFVHETDQWLVFPHELDGLTPDEIRTGKGDLADLILRGRADDRRERTG